MATMWSELTGLATWPYNIFFLRQGHLQVGDVMTWLARNFLRFSKWLTLKTWATLVPIPHHKRKSWASSQVFHCGLSGQKQGLENKSKHIEKQILETACAHLNLYPTFLYFLAVLWVDNYIGTYCSHNVHPWNPRLTQRLSLFCALFSLLRSLI